MSGDIYLLIFGALAYFVIGIFISGQEKLKYTGDTWAAYRRNETFTWRLRIFWTVLWPLWIIGNL